MRLAAPLAPRYPIAFGHLLCAIELRTAGVQEVALVGPDQQPCSTCSASATGPRVVLASAPQSSGSVVELLAGRSAIAGRATAYVCEHFACRAPVSEPDALRALLD